MDGRTQERNGGVAFEILEEEEPTPIGWSKATGHLVWDVKMDFTRKARWVKDGHKTADPLGSNYAGVVSRESVRIAFTYAALNDLDIWACDVQNAYIQAPSSEKHYIVCGAEFGDHVGKRALIRRALYGGKSAGRDYWLHLRSCMEFLGFTPCKADADVWMREAKRNDGSIYWEYVLLYVDDCLCISEDPESIIRNEIGNYFKVKEASIGEPDIYLGGKVRKVELETGVERWAFSSSQYVQEACRNVRQCLEQRYKEKNDHKTFHLPKKAGAPMCTNY